MTTETLPPLHAAEPLTDAPDTRAALRFLTCGSVDDGKSTLIGRLLLDTHTVLQDQLASVQRSGQADLALLSDGLQAEREQGITIDVAYRYFNTHTRKFVMADAPGHVQYTRNMVTAASSADAAVVLVDATKLDWAQPLPALLAQTRRHSLLAHLLRVNAIVFAVNKLDAVANPALAFAHIRAALQQFCAQAGIEAAAIIPVSALLGHNVVHAQPGWCNDAGPTLLHVLERLPSTPPDIHAALALPVQWLEKPSASASASVPTPAHGRRVVWGRLASGTVQVGQAVSVWPSGQAACVVQVLSRARQPLAQQVAGQSAGLVLDRELDISRGDWIVPLAPSAPGLCSASDAAAHSQPNATQALRDLTATVAWMDEQPLVAGRLYWVLHGHRWVKAKVTRIVYQLDVDTLAPQAASALPANAIGTVELTLLEPLLVRPFAQSRVLGALILVDTATRNTAGAALLL